VGWWLLVAGCKSLDLVVAFLVGCLVGVGVLSVLRLVTCCLRLVARVAGVLVGAWLGVVALTLPLAASAFLKGVLLRVEPPLKLLLLPVAFVAFLTEDE